MRRGRFVSWQVDVAVAASLGDGQRESEDLRRVEKEKPSLNAKEERDKEIVQDLERERYEKDQLREADSQRELVEEMAKERDKEKEREKVEASKMIVQRSSKSAKGENGRVQKGERAGLWCLLVTIMSLDYFSVEMVSELLDFSHCDRRFEDRKKIQQWA